MKTLIVCFGVVFCCFHSLYSQRYYPLEINNRWDYDRSIWEPGDYYFSDSFSVKVIGDTLMPNHKTYYILSRNDLSGNGGEFNLVRIDSNFIYYYIDATDVPFYKLNAAIGEQWSAYTNTVELVRVDTINQFNQTSIEMEFKVDGLVLGYVTFSDKFGPVSYHSTGEPPGTTYEDIYVMGCLVSSTQYGTLLNLSQPIQSPIHFDLFQNYPNPFNNSTIIKYQIYRGINLEMALYNVTGERIKLLFNGYQSPGLYSIQVNASDLASGLYFYELKSDRDIVIKKCLLIK